MTKVNEWFLKNAAKSLLKFVCFSSPEHWTLLGITLTQLVYSVYLTAHNELRILQMGLRRFFAGFLVFWNLYYGHLHFDICGRRNIRKVTDSLAVTEAYFVMMYRQTILYNSGNGRIGLPVPREAAVRLRGELGRSAIVHTG